MIRGGPSIIKDGLILEIDPSTARCYVSGSTIVKNLALNATGSVVNMLYNTQSCGVFLGNGASSYVNMGMSSSLYEISGSNLSFGIWLYWNGIGQETIAFSKRNDIPFNQWTIGISNDATSGGSGTKLTSFICGDGGYPTYSQAFNYEMSTKPVGWYYVFVSVGTTSQPMYLDAVNILTGTVNLTGQTFLIKNQPLYYGAVNRAAVPDRFWGSYLGPAHLYNRTLSVDEVRFNYDSLKGRFNKV